MTGAGVGQPLGDPLDQRHPAEAGEHDLRALLLGEPRDVEGDEASVMTPVIEEALALEDSGHGSSVPHP